MAIAPLNQLLLPRLRRAGHQRAFARQVIVQWTESLPGRAVPMLDRLPLPLRPITGGEPCGLSQALMQSQRIQLMGPLGSGRSLALEQLQVQWAMHQITLPATTYPLLIHAPSADADPDVALRTAIGAAGFANSMLLVERGLAAGHWLLLLDDLDALSGEHAGRWRRWVIDIARRYPALALVIVTERTQPWPEFTAWEPLPPSAELLQGWLKVLLPQEEVTLLLGPLLHDPRVRLIGEQLIDVIALAFTYAQSGFAANRARLYATALERILRPVIGADSARLRTALATFGYQSVVQSAPPYVPEEQRPALAALRGLVMIDADGHLRFQRPLFGVFCAALGLAAHPERLTPDLLAAPSPLLPLVTGLMPDPAAVYAAVTAREPWSTEQVLLLGRCMREHHVPLFEWGPRILMALAQLGHTSSADAEQVWSLLMAMPDVVAATVSEQMASGVQGEHWTLQFVRLLPVQLAEPFVLDLITDSRLLRSTRRVAALQMQRLLTPQLQPRLEQLASRPIDDLGRLLLLQALCALGPSGRHWVAAGLAARRFMLPTPHDPSDARSLVEIGSALLSDPDLDSTVHTAATLAMQGCVSEATAPGLLHACTAAAAPLRAAARKALLSAEPSLALRSLGRLVLGDDVHWAARQEALETLTTLPGVGVTALLLRVIASPMPLAGRFVAVNAVLDRPGGVERLRELAMQGELPAALRAHIVRELGARPTTVGFWLELATTAQPVPLRAAVVRVLATSASDESLAVLAGIVEHERLDLEALLAAVEALGALGDEGGIWALRTVLLGPLLQQLRDAWAVGLDRLAQEHPPITWNVFQLPEALRWRWGRALAFGTTAADMPSSLRELVEQEAVLLRTAAAQALGKISGPAARDVLREALLAASSADGYGPAPALANELVRLDGTSDLVYTVQSHGSPLIRWVAARALQSADVGATLRDVWTSTDKINLDPETRSTMLAALGSDPRIVPILETLIVDDQAPELLRLDAVQALGQSGAAHAEGLLLALISSARDDPMLAAAALDVLHPPLTSATLTLVRSLLRMPRPGVDVAAAALRCLVRAEDCESLPLFLRYAQHESANLAVPAIDGLVLCNDSTANAVLSRLAHTSNKSTRIRLHATGALLQLEGADHLPTVRQMLEKGSIAMRLVALDLLLKYLDDPTELLRCVRSAWPLPLRLRLAEELAKTATPQALELLEQVLADDKESQGLRILALNTLSSARYTPALALIEHVALQAQTTLPLRRRAIVGLRPWRHEPTTLLALSSLALDSAPYVRSWALQALQD